MERIYHDAEQIEDPAEDSRLAQEATTARFEQLMKSLSRDWMHDFHTKKAHLQWRIDNRGYPSPAESHATVMMKNEQAMDSTLRSHCSSLLERQVSQSS